MIPTHTGISEVKRVMYYIIDGYKTFAVSYPFTLVGGGLAPRLLGGLGGWPPEVANHHIVFFCCLGVGIILHQLNRKMIIEG